MEKLKLSNGTEFELVSMGISNTQDTRTFTFKSELTMNEVNQIFSNTDNLETVEYISAYETTLAVYNDLVIMKTLVYNAVDEIYSVVISVNEVERTMKLLKNEISTLKETNLQLQETVDTLVLSKLEMEG